MKSISRGWCYLLFAVGICAVAVLYAAFTQNSAPAEPFVTNASFEASSANTAPAAGVNVDTSSEQLVVVGGRSHEGREMTYGEARDLASRLPAVRMKFPNGLDSLIGKPANEIDADLAYEASNLLARCDGIEFELELQRTSAAAVRDMGVKAVLSRLLEDVQWLHSECMALAGRVSASRTELLRVAVGSGVKGAAADLYILTNDNSALLSQVLRDARRGEWLSIAVIASGAAQGVGEDDVRIARATLNEALKDSALRESAEAYSSIAHRLLDTQGIRAAQDQKLALEKAVAAGQSARTFPAQTLSGGQQNQVAGILASIRSSKS